MATQFTLVDHAGKRYPIETDGISLGRHRTCSIVIGDASVSRLHARVLVSKGSCWVRDEGSKAGTFVNRQRITGQHALRAGDQLQVGPAIFRLERIGPSPDSVTAPHARDVQRRRSITLVGIAGASVAILLIALISRGGNGDDGTPVGVVDPTATSTQTATATVTVVGPTPSHTPTNVTMPTATYTPVPAEPEAGGQAATDLIGVERATVRIIPQGTWAEPEGWAVNQTWSGSGFIIDPEGIAVTNNHVVTGAGLLEVYIQGRSEPENATVLGVSECSDLAVIDIDGEGYDYLEWADEPVTRYIDVYAAGFPGNATRVKITNGEVLDAGDVVETDWASVDIAITHSARIRPGNSGGPLVTRDGKVVGINYALSEHFDDSIAISRIEAEPIIDNLRAGLDDHSIGVNGQSFPVDDELAGIWVYSVAAGSPADRTGIQPGDVIASIELLYFEPDVYGLVTMETYCDVLRSHASSDVLNIEVWRPSVDEMLEGQINGRELEVAY